MEDFDIIINMCLEKRCTGKFVLKNGKIISSKNIGITSLPNAPYIVGNLCYNKKGDCFNFNKQRNMKGRSCFEYDG